MEEDILNYIKKHFGEEDAEMVALRLEDYGSNSSEIGKNRIHRCILFLSGGNLDKVDKYTDLANIDFRDVIIPAEYDKEKNWIRDFRLPFDDQDQ